MKIIDEIETICNAWSVKKEFVVITYSPKEGLFAWWIRSNTSVGFKFPEFVIEALELDKHNCWWSRQAFRDMEWSNAYVFDEDQVDMGSKPFVMKMQDFVKHYEVLHQSEYNASPDTVNVVGVDYDKIKNKRPNQNPSLPIRRTLFVGPTTQNLLPPPVAAVSIDQIQDPEYPVTYKVNGMEFATLRDVDKYVNFDKLRKLLFKEFPGVDEISQRHFLSNMIKNSTEVTRLLKGL